MDLSPSSVSIANTLGPVYAGSYVSAFLFGVTTLQAYMYYRHYRKDKISLKLLVAVIWAFDTAHAVLAALGVYQLMIEGASNLVGLFIHQVPVAIITMILMTGLSDAVIRCFYCARIWKLSDRNYFLFGVALIPNIAVLVVEIILYRRWLETGSVLQLLDLRTLFYTTFVLVAASDSVITAILIFLLWKRRSGLQKTYSLINKLMVYIVTTGLLTSIFALAVVITFATVSGFTFVGIFTVLSKLYSNSCLATLNNRRYLQESTLPHHHHTHSSRSTRPGDVTFIPLTQVSSETPSSGARSRRYRTSKPDLEIQVIKDSDSVPQPSPAHLSPEEVVHHAI